MLTRLLPSRIAPIIRLALPEQVDSTGAVPSSSLCIRGREAASAVPRLRKRGEDHQEEDGTYA